MRFTPEELQRRLDQAAFAANWSVDRDAHDFCLAFVFPMNNHYILINSGLPWRTTVKPKEGEQSK